MSLSPLKLDATEKVLLRVHSSYSIGEKTPAEIADSARQQGLRVLAITDRHTVNGIAEMIVAGEQRGLYVIPGIEINSCEGIVLGYFIDYQNEALLEFLDRMRERERPASHEVETVISQAGGLPIPVSMETTILGTANRLDRVLTGDILPGLQAMLPEYSLHKEYFKRMLWRSTNLSAQEFVQSLQPATVKIDSIQFDDLARTTSDPGEIPPDFQGHPFIILRGESLGKTQMIREILKRFGCSILCESRSERYREIAWQIYKMGRGSAVQTTRNLLQFNLDHHLYGERAAQCLILFFQNPGNIRLREIKQALRTEIGRITFYRLEYLNYIDMFFTSFVHMPDEEHVQQENWIVQWLGIPVPQV